MPAHDPSTSGLGTCCGTRAATGALPLGAVGSSLSRFLTSQQPARGGTALRSRGRHGRAVEPPARPLGSPSLLFLAGDAAAAPATGACTHSRALLSATSSRTRVRRWRLSNSCPPAFGSAPPAAARGAPGTRDVSATFLSVLVATPNFTQIQWKL